MDNKYSPDSRFLWYLALIGIISALIYLLSPILTPFLLAAVIAYICNPLVTWLEVRRVPRTLSTVFVMLMAIGIFITMILIMLPLFEKEISRLIERIPSFLDLLSNRLIPWVEGNFDIELQIDVEMLKQLLTEHWQSAGGVAARALPTLKSGGLAILGFLINLVLVPVVLFYMLRDWNILIKQVGELIPPTWQKQIFALSRETDDVLAEFMRGEIAVITIMSIYYVTGLWLVGLEFALPIGLLSGVLVFVPYLGTITGLTLATLAALTQFQEWSSVIIIWAVIGSGQLLEGMLITPRLVGERIGLHPVAVIFSLMAFGQLFGFIGILLALPVSAVLLVLLRRLHAHYMEAMIE
ncbi:Predicted PurR-regulated permease PerM [Nitrosomonas eutropha]|uniref:AI-2E family transporter n=1 Tax=Nitrosomonas TaxID=914 RepID=UPI000899B3E6|nr:MULTISPECIES: AI-2E family transporter [Nitrosomonas]MXS79509.1 AI-2E family transporter [Nitrosomonas sp. GH22]SDW89952.1 Predicted PurR-regulated permease PerM [Nitrosomonas eutropha]